MDAVTTVEKTKKTPVLSGKEKRKLRRMVDRKVNKVIKMTPSSVVSQKVDKLNKSIGANLKKLWFEMLTNIPLDSKNVTFYIERDTQRHGFKVRYVQDGKGTTLETIEENRLTDDEINEKDPNTGSIFGTGINLISTYTNEFVIKVKTTEDDSWSVWDEKTSEVTFEDNTELDSGVIMEMFIPYHSSMGGYKNYVESLRWMLSTYDHRNINKGRTYKLIVTGMETPTENKSLSKPITPNGIEWVDESNKVKPTPDVNGLELEDKIITTLPITLVNVNNDEVTIELNITSLGKRLDNGGYPDYVSDGPMMNVYYKGSDQLAFTVKLRGSSGLVSLNGVVLEGSIDKNELKGFFQSSDKFTSISDHFKETLMITLRPYLLTTYPDNNILERGIQEWFYDLLVNDNMGSDVCDMIRTKYGFGHLNSLTPEQREELVHMEWSSGTGRMDFKVYMDVHIDDKTPVCIIEVKKKDFNRNDRNQVYGYMLQQPHCVKVVSLSRLISEKSLDSWNMETSGIKGSGQLKHKIEFNMIDVEPIGFKGTMLKEYQDRVISKLKNK